VAHSFRVLCGKGGWRDSQPRKPMPASLGVEQDADFAVLLDGNGEIRGFIVGDEIAGGDGSPRLH